MAIAKIRLFVEHPLGEGQTIPLTRDQAHYLFGVMRLGPGDPVLLFNGHDGEWRATVAEASKRGGLLTADEQTSPQRNPPDLWLLFAPIKKARTDFIVEKAAEMGAARISLFGYAHVPHIVPRQKLIDDMTMRHFSVATQRNYIREVGASPFSCGGRPIPRPPRMCASSNWPRAKPAFRCQP